MAFDDAGTLLARQTSKVFHINHITRAWSINERDSKGVGRFTVKHGRVTNAPSADHIEISDKKGY